MYNNIRLEKSLYSITGKTFTQALAELDPDSAYENTELKGLDAFERQLKRFDIHVSGSGSDRVEKFFISAESAVLFPEFVRRSIKKGMDDANVAGKICAAVSYSDSPDFRGLTVIKTGDTDAVAEGNEMPVTKVRLSSASNTLTKYARKLSCSYESVKKQRIESLAVVLRSLGAAIARDVNELCMKTVSQSVTPSNIAGETITFADLAAFWGSMTDHDMDIMVCDPATMANILSMTEMKGCTTEFVDKGMVKTPFGVTLVKCNQLTGGHMIGVDSSCAAEMIFGSDVVVDFDKLISAQCEEISCSVTVGFSVLTEDAVKVLNV